MSSNNYNQQCMLCIRTFYFFLQNQCLYFWQSRGVSMFKQHSARLPHFLRSPGKPFQPSATMCPANLMRPWAHRHLAASPTSSLRLKLTLSNSSVLLMALGWIQPQQTRSGSFCFQPQIHLRRAPFKINTLASQLSHTECERSIS